MRKQILKPTTWIIAAMIMVTAIVTAQSTIDQVAKVEIPLDENDVYCLTRNAYYEAKGDSQMSQIAVTHVVLNRLNDPAFPKSACDVVYQKNRKENHSTVCQFSWYCDKRMMNRIIDPIGWQESLDAVKKAVKLYYAKGVDVTEGSTFYHANYVNPRWNRLEKVTSIGSHIYYKVNEECQNNQKACTRRSRSVNL
jgi:spore germination cell wall hydrolase CwlJ-like protein